MGGTRTLDRCLVLGALAGLFGCGAERARPLFVPYGVRGLCPDTELRASTAFFKRGVDGVANPTPLQQVTRRMLDPVPHGGQAFRLTSVGTDDNWTSYTAYRVGDEQSLLVRVRSRGPDDFGAYWAWERAVPLSLQVWRQLEAAFGDPKLWAPPGPDSPGADVTLRGVAEYQDGVSLRSGGRGGVGVSPSDPQVRSLEALEKTLAALAACPKPARAL